MKYSAIAAPEYGAMYCKGAGVEDVAEAFVKANAALKGSALATGLKNQLSSTFTSFQWTVLTWTVDEKRFPHPALFAPRHTSVHRINKSGVNYAIFWTHVGCVFNTNNTFGSYVQTLASNSDSCHSVRKQVYGDNSYYKETLQLACIGANSQNVGFDTTLAKGEYAYDAGKVELTGIDWANVDKCSGRVHKHTHASSSSDGGDNAAASSDSDSDNNHADSSSSESDSNSDPNSDSE